MRAVTLQPAAGAQGELTGILMIRAYHREPRRRRARRGARPGQLARHEPGDRVDGRLPDDHDPVGRRRRRRPRRVPGGPRAADRRGDDHEPLDARAVRGADRRAARRGPRGRRAGLHGRRQPQRDPRPVQARRGRLRRHALQRPQDVLDAARRRRPGRRAGRGGGDAPAVPARRRASCASDDGTFRLERPGERPTSIGRLRSFVGNTGVLVRAYAYIRAHGGSGLRRGQRRRGPRRELPRSAGRRGRTTSRTTGRASTSSSRRRRRSRSGPASGRSTSPSGSSTTASTRRRSTSR